MVIWNQSLCSFDLAAEPPYWDPTHPPAKLWVEFICQSWCFCHGPCWRFMPLLNPTLVLLLLLTLLCSFSSQQLTAFPTNFPSTPIVTSSVWLSADQRPAWSLPHTCCLSAHLPFSTFSSLFTFAVCQIRVGVSACFISSLTFCLVILIFHFDHYNRPYFALSVFALHLLLPNQFLIATSHPLFNPQQTKRVNIVQQFYH